MIEDNLYSLLKKLRIRKIHKFEDSYEGEEETVVDLEGEIIGALEDLDELRDKYDDLKRENKKLKRNTQKETDILK